MKNSNKQLLINTPTIFRRGTFSRLRILNKQTCNKKKNAFCIKLKKKKNSAFNGKKIDVIMWQKLTHTKLFLLIYMCKLLH